MLVSLMPLSSSRATASGRSGAVKQMWWTCSPRFASRRPSGPSLSGQRSWISVPCGFTNVAEDMMSSPASHRSTRTTGSSSCAGIELGQDRAPVRERLVEVADDETDMSERACRHGSSLVSVSS